MKQAISISIVILTLMGCGNQTNKQQIELSTMENEKMKIEALLSTYQDALNTSDAALAQSLYTKNGIFMPTEAPSAIGSDQILKSYEFIFTQIQLNIQFTIHEIVIENDLAFAVTESKGSTLIHAIGDEIPEANRELFVLQKVDEDWRIARYMFNKTQPK